ncbi:MULTISPECIES: GNAT family N-acetyltransferase [unclassified Flavobacterium]|uniref:GNAT family N-acetyltransferase n=1 Tax=unclassified Flavobacterium TaxID=196869 RepID=UPI001291728D|nr:MULTISPECIES: GNAT family N-acetyltransferase [unclassified Flavobacterium]MQP52973.1 GNAT family N-acetyltransferase [Flavobacterium sp. LMO9]MQP62794.1 GNAT family N-acetyltransferase [Flavobacterium sp. LMO6]
MLIREIQQKDNESIAKVIRAIFHELDAPKVGTAYADPILDTLYEVYQAPRSVYYVVEHDGKVVGGCGVALLENGDDSVCELQKMYFAPEIRGTGYAEKIIEKCLEYAKTQGFEICYLETLSFMTTAQKLYKRIGFENIDGPMGNTGHNSCEVWMIKKL